VIQLPEIAGLNPAAVTCYNPAVGDAGRFKPFRQQASRTAPA
jgi:hypothetical protein